MIKDGGAFILYNKLKGVSYKWARPCKKRKTQGDVLKARIATATADKTHLSYNDVFTFPTTKARAALKELISKGESVETIAKGTGKTTAEVVRLFERCEMPKRTYQKQKKETVD